MPIHGGSLRFYARAGAPAESRLGEALLAEEAALGLGELAVLRRFAARVEELRTPRGLLRSFGRRQRIAAYGAAAKGSTLLNYVESSRELIDYVVDRNPHKQGQYMPGMHAADPRPPRRSSRISPTTCCCWPGTSPTRSSGSSQSTPARRQVHPAGRGTAEPVTPPAPGLPPAAARPCTASCVSSSRSAAASPATACARRSRPSPTRIPLAVHEVPSGTPVFDWTVPREWNIRDAWIKDAGRRPGGRLRRLESPCRGYSAPVRAACRSRSSQPHLHTLPDQPDWIPYRTCYYDESWGFCLPHRRLEALPEGEYEVCIDCTLADGSLTYGECS